MSLAKEGGSARHRDIQRLARCPWCILSTLIDSSVGGFYLGRDAPLQMNGARPRNGMAPRKSDFVLRVFSFSFSFSFFALLFFFCFTFFLFFFSFFPLFFTVRLQASAARRAKKFSF